MSKIVAEWIHDQKRYRLVEIETSAIYLEALGKDAAGGDRWELVPFSGAREKALLSAIKQLAGERDAVAATMDHSQKRFG